MNFTRIDWRRFPITGGLILICVIYYIYTTVSFGISMNAYQAVECGGFFPYAVKDLHEFYRLITGNFIHFGILHILCNCISLCNIGPFVESQFKRYEYAIIIITSMITTNLLAVFIYIFTGSGGFVVSGGISGVVFGILGAIIVLGISYKGYYERVLRSIIPSLVLMLFLSFTISSISWTGHIGGLLGGMASTYYIIWSRKHNYN